MQEVIGQYSSYLQAVRAVRKLEPHGSIQGIVVTSATNKAYARRSRKGPLQEPTDFLVLMSGDRDSIGRARALLAQEGAS